MFQVNPEPYFHVTCAVYNYNGTEIIGSYNDDDIYLFDTRLPSESDYIYRYEGHRNSITGESMLTTCNLTTLCFYLKDSYFIF